jgi:membrane associated rhomboid family serine protease
MLIPIKHENMEARRWPVVTLALIAINMAVFLFTMSAIEDETPELGEIKSHILILAALHPELKMQAESQRLVNAFKQSHPDQWAHVQSPYRDIINAYDARIKMMEDPSKLQAEMDSLNTQLVSLTKTSIVEQYAFVPAQPTALSYLTANFLHGGWLHLIGNMWFLWLAGFVLEDVWGRWLYSAFYLIAGAAALQFYAWSNPGSLTPTLGASGAVAALMGAFDATVKTCGLHLKAHEIEAAFQDYAEFIDNGGGKLPAANWLELCKGAEEMQEFDRACSEYHELAQAYPTDRQALTAQLSAARLCLKRLNRPQDALVLYQTAAVSPIPHLDWDQHIQAGIKEAKAAMSSQNAIAAGAQ